MVKVSVIIPCYNQEKYIAECLDSVISQNNADYEIIVVNDGSTDNSLDIINKYAENNDKIIVINQKNHGVITARNNAIKIAHGEYIYPLDGDDVIAPNCLKTLCDAMDNNLGDVIYSEYEYFGGKCGKSLHKKATKFYMTIGNQVCTSALYRKKDWEKYGGYDEIMLEGLEDWEFWLNFIEDEKFFYKVNQTLFFYRIVSGSRNISISDNTKLKKIIMKKHYKLYTYKFWIKFCIYTVLKKLLRFFYQHKITKSGKNVIKICKVPISEIYSKIKNL